MIDDDQPDAVEEERAATEVEPPRAPAKKAPTKKRSAKKKVAEKAAARASRTARPFPAAPFEESLEIARTIHEMGSRKVRRLTLFEKLNKSPTSSGSRQSIVNSSKYGLITGSYRAEFLELTDTGEVAVSQDVPERQRKKAWFDLAIMGIEPFKVIYDEFAGKRFPSPEVLRDFLREKGVAEDQVVEGLETFTVNAKYVGLIRTLGGAEHLLTVDHMLDETPGATNTGSLPAPLPLRPAVSTPDTGLDEPPKTNGEIDWVHTCFYVTPIGDEDSPARRHSDLFLRSIVEPAVVSLGLTIVRADEIGEPGMISKQIIEYIARSRLVVADLSLHNPNVFYELALRHATRKPVVQIVRKADKIPFDLGEVRTIVVDDTDVYTLVPQLETYKTEVTSKARSAIDGSTTDNPLSTFYPAFWNEILPRE